MCQQIDTLQDVNFSKVLLLLSACEEVRKGFLLRILNFTQVKIGHVCHNRLRNYLNCWIWFDDLWMHPH